MGKRRLEHGGAARNSHAQRFIHDTNQSTRTRSVARCHFSFGPTKRRLIRPELRPDGIYFTGNWREGKRFCENWDLPRAGTGLWQQTGGSLREKRRVLFVRMPCSLRSRHIFDRNEAGCIGRGKYLLLSLDNQRMSGVRIGVIDISVSPWNVFWEITMLCPSAMVARLLVPEESLSQDDS